MFSRLDYILVIKELKPTPENYFLHTINHCLYNLNIY